MPTNSKKKAPIREKDQFQLAPADFNEPADPMDHLLLNVMFECFRAYSPPNEKP